MRKALPFHVLKMSNSDLDTDGSDDELPTDPSTGTDAMRDMMMVNVSGLPGHVMAIDLHIERY